MCAPTPSISAGRWVPSETTVTRTNLKALLQHQPKRLTQPATQRSEDQPSKRAPKPAKKARSRASAARAPQGATPPARSAAATTEADASSGDEDDPSLLREHEAAFARVGPEIDAMPAAGLGRITLHVPTAVKIGFGALPNIEAKQDEFRRRLPEYDAVRASHLRDYARASLYTHLVAIRHATGESRLRALLAEATPLRERMLSAAEVHALYGLLDAGRVAAIRRGAGHLDTANDLVELAMIFRDARAKLAGKTQVTDAEAARADELGFQIIDALGQRDVGTDGLSAPAKQEEDRLKAFWLFSNAYEESRRAMTFVRWYEGDADLLVPSLFSGRRRRSPAEEPSEGPAPVEPVEPVEPALDERELEDEL